jgi:TonB family protein
MRVYESSESAHAFSFFQFVVIGNTRHFSDWERNKILRHEQVHAQRLHSFDILMITVIQILFWFNPLLSFYKRKLIQLHEFEADARSVQNEEVELYCDLLARVALHSSGITLANHFTQSFTLNRITMMKTSNKKMRQWKLALSIVSSLFFMGAVCFYQPAKAQEKNKDEVFTYVDEIPTFPTGFIQFLNKELKYPEAARKNHLQGTTLLSFVIEKDGSMSAAEIKKGFDKECDNEALRAVTAIKEKWTPGMKSGKAVRTQMVMPVQFKL